MHFSFEIWLLLTLWVGGLAWALGLTGDVWRFCRLRWLKGRAVQTLDRCIFDLQMKNLRQCAALRAAGYAYEHTIDGVACTRGAVQELACILAKVHIRSACYTHISDKQAERCYIATFSVVYFLHRGENPPMLLFFGQKKTAFLS